MSEKLQIIASFIYEFFMGEQNNPEYRQSIFPAVLGTAIIIPFILTLLYYPILNRLTDRYNEPIHWLSLFSINSMLVFFITDYITMQSLMQDTWFIGSNIGLGLINLGLTVVFFVFFSYWLRNTSKYARNNPPTPNFLKKK